MLALLASLPAVHPDGAQPAGRPAILYGTFDGGLFDPLPNATVTTEVLDPAVTNTSSGQPASDHMPCRDDPQCLFRRYGALVKAPPAPGPADQQARQAIVDRLAKAIEEAAKASNASVPTPQPAANELQMSNGSAVPTATANETAPTADQQAGQGAASGLQVRPAVTSGQQAREAAVDRLEHAIDESAAPIAVANETMSTSDQQARSGTVAGQQAQQAVSGHQQSWRASQQAQQQARQTSQQVRQASQQAWSQQARLAVVDRLAHVIDESAEPATEANESAPTPDQQQGEQQAVVSDQQARSAVVAWLAGDQQARQAVVDRLAHAIDESGAPAAAANETAPTNSSATHPAMVDSAAALTTLPTDAATAGKVVEVNTSSPHVLTTWTAADAATRRAAEAAEERQILRRSFDKYRPSGNVLWTDVLLLSIGGVLALLLLIVGCVFAHRSTFQPPDKLAVPQAASQVAGRPAAAASQ